MAEDRRRVVIVGNGMVSHRLVAELDRSDLLSTWDVVVVGEESRPAYDRVALSSWFTGATESDLTLAEATWYEERGVRLLLGSAVTEIDRDAKTVVVETLSHSKFTTYTYDHLVFATGSYPFVPPLVGRELAGCFVYRTIDDLASISAWAASERVKSGAVIGGGLLGLEAANALQLLGLETHVLEFAPRLMPLQLCEGGSQALQARIGALGVTVHVGVAAEKILGEPSGSCDGISHSGESSMESDREADVVSAISLKGGSVLATDMVVFSAGIRPRDELAKECGLAVGERGGIEVDELCTTSDPSISAVGECALAAGRIWGLVAPGYEMARVVAAKLGALKDSSMVDAGSMSRVVATSDARSKTPRFLGSDLSTKLKLLGIDVVSFGDAQGTSDPACRSLVWADSASNVYRRIVLGADGKSVIGGVLVGDADGAGDLMAMACGDLPTPADPRLLVLPGGTDSGKPTVTAELSDGALVCSCNNICASTIRAAVRDEEIDDLGILKRTTSAGTGCGGCVPVVKRLMELELAKAGREIDTSLCEHFHYSRVQLLDILRVRNIRSFGELLREYGSGLGCDICKPTVASILASLGTGYILEGERAALQDTNDHMLANIQRDGTYSVIPRIPGGEITPDHLILIGQVAQKFSLYAKITGGQRIDLLGARVEQLPLIWRELVDAGLESGHGYGKALRTVKSCVGETWCRYGVQDSTTLAINLELRYRGLRAPHKLKMAVSGCARECAEAQSKDVGIIATERGWNLWVCGNGGMRPRHADLLAEDLDTETLVRYIDRFFAFYIRTADRLERTSTWLEKRTGGIDELRRIVCEDELGLAEELEALIDNHVRTYECEWKATIEDPIRVAKFRAFVNTDGPDPTIIHITERKQPRPVPPELIGASR